MRADTHLVEKEGVMARELIRHPNEHRAHAPGAEMSRGAVHVKLHIILMGALEKVCAALGKHLVGEHLVVALGLCGVEACQRLGGVQVWDGHLDELGRVRPRRHQVGAALGAVHVHCLAAQRLRHLRRGTKA